MDAMYRWEDESHWRVMPGVSLQSVCARFRREQAPFRIKGAAAQTASVSSATFVSLPPGRDLVANTAIEVCAYNGVVVFAGMFVAAGKENKQAQLHDKEPECYNVLSFEAESPGSSRKLSKLLVFLLRQKVLVGNYFCVEWIANRGPRKRTLYSPGTAVLDALNTPTHNKQPSALAKVVCGVLRKGFEGYSTTEDRVGSFAEAQCDQIARRIREVFQATCSSP